MKMNDKILIGCMALGLGISNVYAKDAHHPEDQRAVATTVTVETPISHAGKNAAREGMSTVNRETKGMMGKGLHKSAAMATKHKQMLSRLDLMEARLAKMETLLERIVQR